MAKIQKTKLIFLAIIFFGFFGLAQSSEAATYYVDNTTTSCSTPYGNNYDPTTDTCGSGAYTVYDTIQGAADVVNPGDTVIVADGTYTGPTGYDTPIVNVTTCGASGAWITFKSENKWGAVLDGGTSGGVLDSGTAYGFKIIKNSNTNCYIKIEDFEIERMGDYGVLLMAVSHISVYGNKIHEIGRVNRTGSNRLSCGITASVGGDNTRTNDYITIDSNHIYDTGRLVNNCNGCDHAIYIGGNHLLIKNNIIHHQYSGETIQIPASVVVYDDTKIINNTFSTPTAVYSEKSAVIVIWGNPANVIIQNNIFDDLQKDAIFCWGHTSTQVIMSNNLKYPSGAPWLNTSYCTPGLFTMSGNISADPMFVNKLGYDFHLQSDSPAINTGLVTNAPSADFDRNTRPQGAGFDIGAYEYVSAVDTTAPGVPSGLSVQ
ncbi:MAG: choice-of-anchor Q domain-containing protein [Parcubacteria group bacterium]